MRAALPRPNRRRRGVTLVEMLVVVALVVLMMTILVQIFQQATGAMSASRAVQELDVNLRQVDLRLRADLAGATARFTPPLDPAKKLGYFEYGENALADAQGEDTDDYIAWTTKAPEGQVFTGRVYIANAGNSAVQPITVTSQLAEVIYFLRNGNLYRRIFLIVPERKGSLSAATAYTFPALSPGAVVGWLGVNEVSMHPAKVGDNNGFSTPNDLGDLTNRENRAFKPRFRNDFYQNLDFAGGILPDGRPDDFNGDDVDDFYPTLYPNLFNHYRPNATSPGLINENATLYGSSNSRSIASLDVHAFPYIFPGMYSKPATGSAGTGWIHSIDPSDTTFNHYPLPTGDNLPTINPGTANQQQTWWGFPTWRETLSPNWIDPIRGITLAANPRQVNGLRPFPPGRTPAQTMTADATYAYNMLPPAGNQYGTDLVGSSGATSFDTFVNAPGVWDDDLILTNVRSFDVKAYDVHAPLYTNAANNYFPSAGYYDLGDGIRGNHSSLAKPGLSLDTFTPESLWGSDNQPQGFLHAGRMPPLGAPATTGNAGETLPGGDNRVNPSRPFNPFDSTYTDPNDTSLFMNYVGDSGAGVVRLTRVWDSWSTDYTNAPAVDIYQNGHLGSGQPLPIYPSYPAPYTSPLRGIQIQIRVADPKNERVKVLTIRQDFTDKL